MTKRQPVLERIAVRLYADDADLLNWLRSIPEGGRNQAAKDLLRRGLEAEKRTLDRDVIRQVVCEALGETQSTLIEQITDIRTRSAPDLDSDVVRRAVQEAMRDTIEEIGVQERAQSFDLSDIRRVINAALQQYLDHLVLGENASGDSQNDVDDDDEAQRIEELLSNFDRVLIKK